MPKLEKNLFHRPGISGSIFLCACPASILSWPWGTVYSPPPSCEVTLQDTNCEKSAVYCPHVLVFLAFLTSELYSPVSSRTMQIVLSKGKKLTLLHFQFIGVFCVFFFFNKKYGRCILCLVILGVLLIFCFEGEGASQAIQREHGSRGHLKWKEHLEEKKPNSVSF